MAAALIRSRISAIGVGRSVFPQRAQRFTVVHAMATGQAPKYHLLQYKYVPDILEKREPHRKGHLDAIKDAIAAGKIVIGGAIADPVDGGLLIFEGLSKEEVEAYAKADPYYTGGLIQDYNIRSFMRVQ